MNKTLHRRSRELADLPEVDTPVDSTTRTVVRIGVDSDAAQFLGENNTQMQLVLCTRLKSDPRGGISTETDFLVAVDIQQALVELRGQDKTALAVASLGGHRAVLARKCLLECEKG